MQNLSTNNGLKLKHLPLVPVLSNRDSILKRTWVKIENMFEDNGAATRIIWKSGPHAELVLVLD